MNLWQRAIAILVLMVFLPASVLAGTPLRLCVGDNGHRAIEFVLTSDHHQVEEHHEDCSNPGQSEIGSLSECTDSPLLTVAQKPAPAAQLKVVIPFDDLQTPALMPAIFSASPIAVASAPAAQTIGVSLRDAQLDALRTIILLI